MNARIVKIWTLLLISLILGVIITFRDVSLCVSLINNFDNGNIRPAILDTLVTVLYTVIMIFCLLWINLKWTGRGSKNEGVLFLVSIFTLTLAFTLSTYFPFHAELEDYYHRYIFSTNRPPHHKVDGMLIKSVVILFTCYIGALIFKLYINKIESAESLEKLRAESLQSKLTALSNQISPHFFFNALNSLHSLIIEDKKDSSLSYLSALSNVFRYILRGDVMSLITLKEELDFIEEYKYMLAIKYGSKLKFETDIEPEQKKLKLPVMSLLPLIENVIKHNEISSANQMTVHLAINGNFLIIKNRIKKKIDPPPSEKIGLSNLNNRYKLLVNREIKVIEDSEIFSVYLPLTGETV